MMASFAEAAVMEALARASASLRAAGISKVWLDMSGSGWTQSYVIAIAEAEPDWHTIQTEDRGPVRYARLRPAAQKAAADALAHLDPGGGIVLEFESMNHHRANGKQVWPAADLISDLEAQITRLQARLASLQHLK